MRHVLIEVSGGVVSNVIAARDTAVWLRDYDDLEAKGHTVVTAERVPPVRINYGPYATAPAKFTR